MAAALIVSLVLLGGCGKKGPPLAPLDMSPESPGTLVARRLGNTVYLQMNVPAKSAVGQGAFSIDHLEVYAVTLAPGAVVPPNRDLLKAAQMVAQIPVAQPLDPEAAEPDKPETRPRPGDAITFIETLTPDLRGRLAVAIDVLTSTPPDGLNHNLETVPRLYRWGWVKPTTKSSP